MALAGPADPERFLALNLRVHELLRDVPLHDVWELELPGGGEDRSVVDVVELMRIEAIAEVNPVVRGLFALRSRLGEWFGWDEPQPAQASSFGDAVPDELRSGSLLEPGTSDGPFTVLYATPTEAVGEIRNATVHAFSVQVLTPAPGGHRLFWAIYVAPVSRLTPFYMALIAPFRRFLVYPAILASVRRSWIRRFGAGD